MPQLTDEELDRLLYAAGDRARTPIDAKPDAEALAMLDRIMATDPHPHRTRNRVVGWGSSLVAAAAAVAIGVSVVGSGGAAVAGTPSPLQFEGSTTVTETIQNGQAALAASSGPAEPARTVRSANWSFNINGDTGAAKVVPQLTVLRWEADGSGLVTYVEGEPYDPSDAAANAGIEVVSSGKITRELVMAPGDFTTPVTAPPGTSKEEIEAALAAFGMPKDPSASQVLQAIESLLQQWTLTNAQESQLLGILADATGSTALGTSTDRLGRSVSGIRVPTDSGAASDVLLISTETGRIIGLERTVLVADDLLPAGAVLSYWVLDIGEVAVR
ncbi:hypothetical protein GCM10009651_02210 [Microbacterium natoriense]|uniref:hypothetical protein n=1 Tax=Microbacterium natoriense TaxID=284570 RepID=UPI0031D20320